MDLDKSKIIVDGEASESDEDDQIDTITSPPTHSLRISDNAVSAVPSRQAIVVSGEASESESEDEINVNDDNEDEHDLPPIKVLEGVMPDVQEPHEDAKGDETQSSQNEKYMETDKPKYETLLHRKLKEKNVLFRRRVVDTVSQMYTSATKDLYNTTQQLMRSQIQIQDVSYNMRLLTNGLFHLEDRIDIISTCNLLPNIRINVPSLLNNAHA